MKAAPIAPAGFAVLLAGLLAGCGSVSHHVATDLPEPRRIAVLPLAGAAPNSLREAARQLLHSRIQARGYQVPELAWVDQQLAEHGWLRDPARFEPTAVALPELLTALDADAVAIGTGLDETRFNWLVLRRHAVHGQFELRDAAGGRYWTADHTAGATGGFLLTSGQVITELRAQGEHGSSMASLALVDELVGDVVETLPLGKAPSPPAGEPFVQQITVRHQPTADGGERFVVEAKAPAGATVRFQLEPGVDGVPMATSTADPQRFVGAIDLPAGTKPQHLVVSARDAYGRKASAEVRP